MEILITLCARGGSKGIPGKNIRMLNGKPLMAYSIELALAFAKKFDADVVLSTDDSSIKEVASLWGLRTPYERPQFLATDVAGKIDTITDLLLFEEESRSKRYDFVLDLDVTSPLRNLQDLEAAFKIMLEDPDALNLFSVNEASRNPYFNMVEQQENGYYSLVKTGLFLTRQSAPQVYDLNASFYIYRRAFFDKGRKTTINERSLVYIMPHMCFDLDHNIDFDYMEYLISNNKLGFEL